MLREGTKDANLYAGEERRDRDTDHEQEQEDPVDARVPLRVEYGEEDEARAAEDGAQDREHAKDPFPAAHGWD